MRRSQWPAGNVGEKSMRNDKRRWLPAVLAGLCALLLSGCNALGLDVEDYLRPPKSTGEQEAIQQALETYIEAHAEKGGVTDYILKYPKEGSYRSAFILVDQVQPNRLGNLSASSLTENKRAASNTMSAAEATQAVAFYRLDVEQAKTHVNYLRKIDDEWVSVSDVEGSSEGVSRVSFGDLNGDGAPELLVGWSQYNTRNQKLALYFLNDTLEEQAVDEIYTHMLVNEFTGSGRDDLMLFSATGADAPTSVKLLSYEDGRLVSRGTAELDAGIQRFGTSKTVALSETVNGVFIDCYKYPNTTITELLFWDAGADEGRGRLETPFYRAEDKLTTLTARESSIPLMDIDGDGMVEWPLSSRLPGYETVDAADALWKTTWMTWDYATRQSRQVFSCVMNERDGYYVLFDESWDGKVTAIYDRDTRLLQFRLVGEESTTAPFLSFKAAASSESPEEEGSSFHVLSQLGGVQYSVRYTKDGPFALNMERIRYMFSLLPADR